MTKRFVVIATVIIALAVVAILITKPARQPKFGNIERAKMVEPHAGNRVEQIVSAVKGALHLSTMDTRQRNYMKIGEARMEWSLMSTADKTGWLYFTRPEANEVIWEFAPSSRSNLNQLVLTDVNVEFVQYGDTNRIASAFDVQSRRNARLPLSGRAIPVREGQIVLARLIESPHSTYAIRFVEQRGGANWGSMDVEYVEINTPENRKTSAAER